MNRIRDWLSPVVYLSTNPISLLGVVLVTGAVVSFLFVLPTSLRGETHNPYLGMLVFLLLPGAFFTGLVLIPAGILWSKRRQLRRGLLPAELPPLDFKNVKLRRLLVFVGVATAANVILAGQFTYGALGYMDGVTFCGQTCHTVMAPEYTAYQNSPHSRVECVKCHIGPGASWFVKSKLSGVGQVFAVAFNTYERPIPTPVHDLRPARETCEVCHWPHKYGEDRLRIRDKFAEDETNTRTRNVLLIRIGGGRFGGPGIHGAHLGEGHIIRYRPADEKRQLIPWVESVKPGGSTLYLAAGAKPEQAAALPLREMDCVDCHNRPTHVFDLPETALNNALAAGAVSRSLPFSKKHGLELLKRNYASRAEAESRIPAEFQRIYREQHASVWQSRRQEVEHSARGLLAIYQRNIFPEMKLTWGTYINNIGHSDFPGCFRCHDDQHEAPGGKKLGQDCNSCHQLLAMEEAAPKILGDLGLEKQ